MQAHEFDVAATLAEGHELDADRAARVTGGRLKRTNGEFSAGLAAADLKRTRDMPTSTRQSLVEAVIITLKPEFRLEGPTHECNITESR
jgi:hypothetical protein